MSLIHNQPLAPRIDPSRVFIGWNHGVEELCPPFGWPIFELYVGLTIIVNGKVSSKCEQRYVKSNQSPKL